jgi:predicted DCC family thiol-disulfide oxidoreductase YuxK
MKPILIFDGDCGFCRRWVARWKAITEEAVDYAPYQEVSGQFPDLSKEDFSRSLVLIEAAGNKYQGAEAVFRVLQLGGRGGALYCYRHLPFFSFFSELFYRLVASHRSFFSALSRFFWGKVSEPPTYALTRRIYFAFLGLIYFFAFTSLALQIRGLVGSNGILPASEFLEALTLRMGSERFWQLPTLFWFHSSDFFLQFIPWAGAALSLLLALGLIPLPITFLLWIFYLSLFNVGGIFLGYQWDVLLLEAGFLSIFFAPWSFRSKKSGEPSHAVLWLLRWLLFRLMFSSGMVKLLSGDPTWHDLTALTYHYETQPLPTWIGYYFHQLPLGFQKFSCEMMFLIEIYLPFLIFTPRKLRMAGGLGMIGFQILIMATGNYNFFNLLAIALCLTLFDDGAYRNFKKIFAFRKRKPPEPSERVPKKNLSPWVLIPVSLFLFSVSWVPFLNRLEKVESWPRPLRALYHTVDRWDLVNSYGLFAVMTTKRLEITVEGSRDGENWLAYEFKWKPGDLKGRPGFVEPFQPRLDWQMWFQALAPYRDHSWFHLFLDRLLEGSPEVLALVKKNPFPNEAPTYVRAMISEYHFTDLATHRETGAWWRKGEETPYSPVLSVQNP